MPALARRASLLLLLVAAACKRPIPERFADVTAAAAGATVQSIEADAITLVHDGGDPVERFRAYAAALEAHGWRRTRELHTATFCESHHYASKDKESQCHEAVFERRVDGGVVPRHVNAFTLGGPGERGKAYVEVSDYPGSYDWIPAVR